MQDPYGFLRHPRQEAGKQTVRQRVRHWREYVRAMPESQAARQARRCMDCGTPYCHRYCPVHNLIPEWNELITEAHWQRAYQQLDSTNNFPELTGRLCPAPCEDACTLRRADQPVTIKGIERAIADRAGNRVGCGTSPAGEATASGWRWSAPGQYAKVANVHALSTNG